MQAAEKILHVIYGTYMEHGILNHAGEVRKGYFIKAAEVFFYVLQKTARSTMTVENAHNFFNVPILVTNLWRLLT